MKPIDIALLILGVFGSSLIAAASHVQPAGGENVRGALEKMPESLEVRFALSALPPQLRDNASVYVLDPSKGYALNRTGSNGQNCFVGRTEWKFADYRNDVYVPICFDATGAKNQMQVWFDAAALRAQDISPEAARKEIKGRFSAGTYKAPDYYGFSYMTAPLMRTYMGNADEPDTVATMSIPHVMYYAPNVTDADVGSIPCPPCSAYPFVAEPGPHGYIIQSLGSSEAAKIVADESALLQDLCAYRSALCLPSR